MTKALSYSYSWRLTVVICVLMLISACACAAYTPGDPEFRAFWVDAWHAGALSQSDVNYLLGVPGTTSGGAIRAANCNAVVVQVRRDADANYPSSMGEPYMSGLSPSDFNALQAVINAAHDTTGGKQRIEVHAWMVVFRTSGKGMYSDHIDPPTGNLIQFDNYWPTRDNAGNETADKAVDPGHPLCAEYTVNVAMDLVTNFDIDAIHYDYVRFTAHNQGYNPTSVARYNARYGLEGQPANLSGAHGDSHPTDQWDQWRRDQITAVVRKAYARIQSVKPWVKQTASFVTWNPSPTTSTREAFKKTRPYYDVYCDWDAWLEEGIIDAAIPMTYYDNASLPNDYLRWMNFEKDRKFDRHMYIGPGIYLNSLANSILQLQMTRDPSPAGNFANGFCGYSYFAPWTKGGTNYGSWSEFMPLFVSQVATSRAEVPDMPWKSSPIKGHISGTVTVSGTNAWMDGATVSVAGPENRTMLTDGTGFYAFIGLTPGTYTVTVSKTGAETVQRQVAVAIGEVTGNMYVNDFSVGASPTIFDVKITNITDNSATVSWMTDLPSSSSAQYGVDDTYGSATPVDGNLVTVHSITMTGLVPLTEYHFRVVSANATGTSYSRDFSFTSGSRSLTVVPIPELGGTCSGGGWYVPGAPATISASANGGYFFTGWSTKADGTGIISSANPYTLNMPVDALTLYAIFQSSVGDIIVESMPGGLNYDWYSDVSFAVSSVKSSAPGCTPGISSRYTTITSDIGNRYAQYKPAIPIDGDYEVWVTWAKSTNGGSQIRHTVTYRDGEYTKTFNQSTLDNKWNYIGTFPFAAGEAGSGAAELKQWVSSAQSGKRIMADAVKWVYVGPFKAVNPNPPHKATEIPPSNPTLSWSPGGTTGAYDVYFGTDPGALAKVSSLQTSTTYNVDVLASTTTYYWRVDSLCLGKLVTGDTWRFTTAAVPPNISNIEITGITSESAVITWDTDQPATSQVEYGEDSSYGHWTTKNTSRTNTHSVTLLGLTPNTLYYFRVLSDNSLAMTGQSSDQSFATKPESLTFIVDNPQGTSTGTWTPMTDAGGWPVESSQYVYALNKMSSTTATFTWTPNIPVTGKYNVYCWYKAGTDRTTSARYTIAHADGQMSVAIVNQAKTGGQWVPIATMKQFTKGTSGYVQLTNKTGETDGARKVIADAIKFEYADVDENPPSVPQNLEASAVSTSRIDLTWDESIDDYALMGYKVYRGSQVVAVTSSTHYADTGLTGNTRYTYSVLAYDATGNESARCAGVNRYTLSPTTTINHITCDRQPGIIYPTNTFTFTNQGYGAGKVSSYRYVWDNLADHTWTDAESQWAGTQMALEATNTKAWYFHAKGYNGDGVASGDVVLGPFYAGTEKIVGSIAEATKYPDGTAIQINAYTPISAVFSDRFYIQEQNRTRGLRCDAGIALPVGTQVKVKGTLATANSERYLAGATIVESVAGSAPRPIYLRTNALGGKSPDAYTVGFANADQIFNAGLLVRVAGKVVSRTSGQFVIIDGTGHALTVRSAASPSVGAFIGATGIVTAQGSACVLQTQSAGDVRVYSP